MTKVSLPWAILLREQVVKRYATVDEARVDLRKMPNPEGFWVVTPGGVKLNLAAAEEVF